MGDTVSIPDHEGNYPREPNTHVETPQQTVEHQQPLATPNLSSEPTKVKTKSKTKRCPQCRIEGKRRKLTIANSLNCDKCQKDLCTDHISAHECGFDHHKHHQQQITDSNPVIKFKKIDQI